MIITDDFVSIFYIKVCVFKCFKEKSTVTVLSIWKLEAESSLLVLYLNEKETKVSVVSGRTMFFCIVQRLVDVFRQEPR